MSKLYFLPLRPAFDSAGITVPGSQHWFTLAGTNTPSAPYTDSTLTTRLENPVIANGIGYLPPVYLNETAGFYRVRVYLPDAEVGVDTPIEEYDPYEPANALLTYLGDSGFDGLFVDASTLIVPTGINAISTTGYSTLGVGGATYVYDATVDAAYVTANPRSSFRTANGRGFRLDREQDVNPYIFGATGQGASDVDDGPAFTAMEAFLATFEINPVGGGDSYSGSPRAWIVGDFYLGTTSIEPRRTGEWIGAGSSHFWAGGAASRVRWADGVHGFLPQFINTSGATAVIASTKGCAQFKAKGIRFEGGYTGNPANEGLWHGAVPRCPFWFEDCHFVNWSGTGLRSWAGNVSAGMGTAGGSFGGNVSESMVIRCKFENNYVGWDNRGSEASIIRGLGNAYYQNRLAGRIEDNGAGSVMEIDPHFAYNGRTTLGGYYTQTSTGGYRYALRIGGDKNNAPSGGPTHTLDWLFIEAGGAIAGDIPAYNAALDFRVGGDLLTLNSAGYKVDPLYSEFGGFSQLNDNTEISGGTLGAQYAFGGHFMGTSGQDGYRYRTTKFAPIFNLDNEVIGGTAAGVVARKGGIEYGGVRFFYGAFNLYDTPYSGGHVYRINGVIVGTNDASGFNVPTGAGYYVNGVRVLGGRQTGWAADTGTAKRTANATYTAGATLTFSAGYVQAELTAVATRLDAIEAALQATSRTQKALKDDFITLGAIGA
jgi:hypothetical protein